jgi:hypothetical protein
VIELEYSTSVKVTLDLAEGSWVEVSLADPQLASAQK